MPAPTLQFRIAEIDARRPSSGAIIECLRFDDEPRQKKGATILALAEIHATVYVYERLLDTVHAAITQARTLVAKMEGDPMIRFEKIIQKVNEALAQFASTEATPIHWQRVNLFIFQLGEEHLCFSGIGALTNVFLQHQESGSTKPFDLLGSLEQPETPDPQKPLASIVCGNLNVGDVLFIGTQNMQPLREKIGLVPLCQAHPPVTAALEIQQQLQALRSLESYFGVIIAGVALTSPNVEAGARTLIAEPAAEPEPPVHAIHQTEQETENILEHGSETAPAALGSLVSGIVGRAKDAWKNARSPVSGPASGKAPLSPLSLAGLRGMNAGYARGLFAERRSALVVAAVVLVSLIGGGLWLRSVRAQQAEQRLWTAIYDQAVEAKNRAEAALVYNDEDRVRAQFTQAMGHFQQLDDKTPDRAQARAALQTELNEIRTRLRRQRTVTNPTVIADLREGGQAVGAQQLVVQDGNAYSLDVANNRLLRVDLETGSTTRLTAPEGASLRLLGTGREAPLVSDGAKGLLTVRNQTLAPLNTSALRQASAVTALTTYGQRAYAVDQGTGMVWRYTLSASGLSGENSYLREPLDLAKRATAIAIDASVYLGSANGEVSKFTSGQQDAWSLAPIDPPLKQLNSLWTSADSPVITIVDQSEQRILVYTKAGRLVEQLLSPDFKELKAAWGDPKTNTLYLLEGDRLLKTDLPRE